ncbi:MAG: ATP-binding protein [Candidatus Electrothrix sp. GW3-4]|uniref:AAA family ATPase n=1 Tax=Candidatus Electrothrix sp. GW3-4 TaxID=3126740 RepID=UPI0030D31C7D
MNTLTFNALYKSICSLNSIDLPSFVILTGRNGSGKTHLLEALSNGKVSSSLVQNIQNDVILYDWNSIIPKDTGVFHVHQHLIQRSNWFNQIKAQQDQILPNLQQQLISLGIPSEHCSTIYKIRNLNKSRLKDHVEDSKVDAIYEKIKNIQKSNGQNIFNQTQRHIGDEFLKKLAPEVVQENPELFLETSESKFFNNKSLLWGQVDPFQQAFGRLFSTYRDLIHQNDRLEKYPPADGDVVHLSPERFLEEYGEPPWDFVNRILSVCELDFRVNSPPLHETASFEPRLNKMSSEVDMRFGDLSSGEKVLMSFALCLYNASDARQKKRFPRLLLLDEVDAPLHPSMVVSLLKTIQSVLVDEKGISVILTTHSPSTVALANEDSLYEMNPIGPQIDKCSKGEALSILTAGVPTLSISFEGRRQVFVESKTDAGIYESLYQAYKGDIGSERSLNFIEVGHRPESGGETNAGCAQVQRIVKTLCDNGNESVFGLVDWDGNVSETTRVKVLSPTIRNGLESAIFDPAILFASCVRNKIRFMREKGMVEDGETYVGLNGWDQERWQRAVNKLQSLVLGSDLSFNEDELPIEYQNGMNLLVRKDYLHLDDHRLEECVVSVFGFLKPHNNQAGGLMRHIIESTLADMPSLLPIDVIDTYKRILGD